MMLSIKPGDKYYQVVLERLIECPYVEGEAYDLYKDGEVYIDAYVYFFEINRARELYGTPGNDARPPSRERTHPQDGPFPDTGMDGSQEMRFNGRIKYFARPPPLGTEIARGFFSPM
jgi:hypothetical protein